MAVGAGPFGTGSNLEIDFARAERVNAVLVTFTTPPQMSDPATFWDALNPANWTLTAFDPSDAKVRLAQYVERVDALTARVLFDGPLDSLAQYTIRAENLESLYGVSMLTACAQAIFQALQIARPVLTPDSGKTLATDIANPWGPEDDGGSNLGTFQITNQGDYANDSGRVYLRKRVIRRVTTGLGGFFHLPDYGLGMPIKGTILPSMLRSIQTRARTQIMQEPDVIACNVTAQQSPDDPFVVILNIKIRDTNGTSDSMVLPVPVGGGF